MRHMIVWALGVVLMLSVPLEAKPLRVEITQGIIEPTPIAITGFLAKGDPAYARQAVDVIGADLVNTGLFRLIPSSAHIARVTSFDAPIGYGEWKAINAQALVTGQVIVSSGRIELQFRLYDVFLSSEMGKGLRFAGALSDWRRISHRAADAIYSRLTGEDGYFDSQVVFVAESGPKDNRSKRLALMDYDGANARFLTSSDALVLSPTVSPDGRNVLYTSYASGFPRAHLIDLVNLRQRSLEQQDGAMSFAPRFSPDGGRVVYSLTRGGNTDLYELTLGSGKTRRLTQTPAIETSPSFSPDGSKIVFESDRSGGQQLYIMDRNGQNVQRISFGEGRYGTPVWSPRGDMIAFTKQLKRRFHIGVMRIDGSEERLLTSSFLDEAPSWSPNGRVLMFTRETSGARGSAKLYSVDISGRNLRTVPTNTGASDASWARKP